VGKQAAPPGGGAQSLKLDKILKEERQTKVRYRPKGKNSIANKSMNDRMLASRRRLRALHLTPLSPQWLWAKLTTSP
jgi:hypothetical protein